MTAAPARSARPCSAPTSPPARRPTPSSSTSPAPARSTIAPLTPLPTLTHATIIDGYSQPGASPNTLTSGDNAVIEIQLSGGNISQSDGLDLAGGGSTVDGLSITGFANGVHLTDTTGGDLITGDFLGQNDNAGLFIDGAPSVTVGGTTPAARDVISSNYGSGIDAGNATGVVVQGDYVGTDFTGTVANPNYGTGVSFVGSPSATIGGSTAAAGNVISGNYGNGIQLNDSVSALVEGNLIGTDVTGTQPLGNGGGLEVGPNPEFTATDDTILDNVLSANGGGMSFYTSTNNVIQGNLIGTDITGTKPLGNSGDGIYMADGGIDTIGGTAAGQGNVISNNGGSGIAAASQIFGDNLVQGNLIGTDITGTVAMGNAGDGIAIFDEFDNTIGGTTAAAANVISNNGSDGIGFLDVYASGNLVQGNYIGTNAAGAAMGNGGRGVYLQVSNNTIGGTTAAAGNVIAYNAGAGVAVGDYYNSPTGVEILSNSIYANGGLGIDLGDDGVTPNHPGGPIPGPNNFQNYPVLFVAATYNGQTYIKGTLNSAADTSYTVQFFANVTPDPSGYGQGQTYLGQATVTTDSSGNATFQVSFSTVVPAGQYISSTATDPTGDTSEFSADVSVVAATTPIVAVNDQYHVDLNTTLTVPAPGVQANDLSINGQPFTSVVVTGPSDGRLTLNPDGSFTYTPKKNFVGTDTFTYEDVQGSTVSNVATVTIDVNPKVYTVTNTNDSGPGSFRAAILGANLATSAPPDTINFDIPGTGPFTIAPLTPLPALTHATVINGYSQPGAKQNTLASGDNAVIEIQLSGGNIPGDDGLVLAGGGNSTVLGLSIAGFTNGVHITDPSGGDLIAGDFIGVAPYGGPAPNYNNGVFIDGAPSVTVGGTALGLRDVISANYGSGIYAQGATGVLVQGDFIGTNPAGNYGFGNFEGVNFYYSPSATIGGAAAGARNIISASSEDGIQLDDSVDALVQGNLIGTDVTGTQPLGNGWSGLEVGPNPEFTATNDVILNNVMSANGGGMSFYTSTNNVIQGNLIGTDITGTKPLGNNGTGIYMADSGINTIGGTAAGQGNVISNNNGTGILATSEIFGDNLIQGNKIGTNLTGTVAMGNAGDGILDFDEYDNTIGGTTKGAGNIISNNGSDGIAFLDVYASGNLVQGNYIGTNANGAAMGNGGFGVNVQVSNNTIGGTSAADGNVIAYNAKAGVVVISSYYTQTTGVEILSNSIYANGALGIDLGDDGVTPNHPGGPIPGPNNDQNFPVLTSAGATGAGSPSAGRSTAPPVRPT